MKLNSIALCVCSAFLVQVQFYLIFFYRIVFNQWIYIFQMCLSLNLPSYGDIIQRHVNSIDGVSERFKKDVNVIYEKNKENVYVVLILDEFVSVHVRKVYSIASD